jgi:hypothetical protein
MRAQLLLVALAGLLPTAAIASESGKVPVRPAEQTAPRDSRIVIASVKEPPAATQTAGDPEAELPAKQRRGRVTNCRCGDQNPSD